MESKNTRIIKNSIDKNENDDEVLNCLPSIKIESRREEKKIEKGRKTRAVS